MAYSRVPFTYTGGPQVFPTNFALGVLEVDHITVTVNGVVDGLGNPVEYAFTYNNATGNVTVTDTLTIGQSGFITRAVPVDALIADFEAGADVSKRNLVRAVKQTLMAVQEAADGREADSILINETVEDVNTLIASIADDVAAVNAAAAQTAIDAANADADAASALASKNAAEAAAASTNFPSIAGGALQWLRVNAAATAYELRTAAQVRADLSINGIGSDGAPTITNLNTLTVAGEYFSSAGATGSPNSTDAFSVKHYVSNSTDFAFQEAFSHASGARWWRREVSGVWTAWRIVDNNAGEVSFFARNSAPDGWLKANGAAVSRTVYADLFAAIGTTFGAGNGTTTFNLPDLRGEFIRGWDDSRGVDSGRVFGSVQTDAIQDHNHTIPEDTLGSGAGSFRSVPGGTPYNYGAGGGRITSLLAGSSFRSAAETRPRNIALLACIKF